MQGRVTTGFKYTVNEVPIATILPEHNKTTDHAQDTH